MFKRVLVVLFCFFVVFKPPFDPDFGWHFKYGEYFVQNFSFLRENVFSYTFNDYAWANSYWVAQVLLYLQHEYLGALGLGLIMSAGLVGALFFIFKKAFDNDFSFYFALVVTSLLLSKYIVVVRPLFFSSIFMLVLVGVLLYWRKYIVLLPLLFLIWANSHADFTLGLFVFGVYGLSTWVQAKKPLFNQEFFAGLASVLATFINPYFYHLHLTLLKEMHPFQFNFIAEWQPYPHMNSVLVYFIFLSAFGAVAAYELREKFGIWYWLVAALFLALSIRSNYFFRVSIIISIFAMVTYVNYYGLKMAEIFSFKNKAKILRFFYAAALVVFFSGAYIFSQNARLALSTEAWSRDSGYPVDAIAHLRQQNYAGNIFNYYDWGGYLIWQFGEYKTFVDGRMPSWRTPEASLFEDYVNIISEPDQNFELFEAYVEKYNISVVFFDPKYQDFRQALAAAGWTEAYADDIAFIKIRPSAL